MAQNICNTESKILTLEQVTKVIQNWRLSGQSVVFTNGCFDLIHLGHIDYLEKARQLGDKLIVGLNTDNSIRLLKGSPRPITTEYARVRHLAALQCVDIVILFNEQTPRHLIEIIRPDVLVKGGDYTIDRIVGADTVLQYGGRVEIVPLISGYSTTALIEMIQAVANQHQ